MPAPEHVRIAFSGVFNSVASPSEIWSCRLACGLASPPGEPFFTTKTELEALAPTLLNRWSLLAPGLSSSCHATGIKVSLVRDTGRTAVDLAGAYVQGEASAAIAGGSATPPVPQIALAITLQSEADGPTGRGRFFLPGPLVSSTSIDNTGRLLPAAQTGHLTRAVAFIDGLNVDLAAAGFAPVSVPSAGSISRGIAPALREVTSVSVGRALDTQRRRRNALAESYMTSQLA